MELNVEQYVDPAVTRAKFEKELNSFFDQYNEWQKKGVFLIRDEFPISEFLFLCPKLFPVSCIFAVRVDFTNYDADPPSVRFIEPYTGKLVKRDQIPLRFKQKASTEYIAQKNPKDPSEGMDIVFSLEGEYPIICHPGFKDYHDHPYHTGDSWLLRRTQGEGRLYRILQVLHSHSIALVDGMGIVHSARKEFSIVFNQRKP